MPTSTIASSTSSDKKSIVSGAFCWTKFGTEAGESIESIRTRKEMERQGNGGVFLWGIGNSIRPSLLGLLEATSRPRVVFSPMLSAPSPADVSPSLVVQWGEAYGIDGSRYVLPRYSNVTSRARTFGSSSPRHFALVCYAEDSIVHDAHDEWVSRDGVRNYLSGGPLGASQVTSVVRTVGGTLSASSRDYMVAFRATLVYPYLVTLRAPRVAGNANGQVDASSETCFTEQDALF